MRWQDLVLIAFGLGGIIGGVAHPSLAHLVEPLVLPFLMGVLFLSFLGIDFGLLLRPRAGDLGQVAVWAGMKLIVLPLVLWMACSALLPGYALSVLILTGISTGVTAPFFAAVLGADPARVLQMTVATSLLVPVTLPALIKLLAGTEARLEFWPLFAMLGMVIFTPLILAVISHRFLIGPLGFLARVRFPLSVGLIFFINLGVAAKFADFVRAHLDRAAAALGLGFVLAAVYLAWGWGVGRLGSRWLMPLNGAIGMTIINNVLSVVFAAQFFAAEHPEAPLVAAVYMIPLFVALLPLRWLSRRKVGRVP